MKIVNLSPIINNLILQQDTAFSFELRDLSNAPYTQRKGIHTACETFLIVEGYVSKHQTSDTSISI